MDCRPLAAAWHRRRSQAVESRSESPLARPCGSSCPIPAIGAFRLGRLTDLPTIAYITNQFPAPLEWYVIEEIRELRRAGLEVVPCSSRRVDESILPRDLGEIDCETLFLQPLQWRAMAKALWICCSRFSAI